MAQEITSREKDYTRWYTDVIAAAELADYAPVRGCMVIRPYGYAIWENMQRILDDAIKATGHQNAYFPLLIPKSFFAKEAEHVEGFAKECAIVTHSRLKATEDGIAIDPASKLEEELIVRPTSETIINAMFAKWIQSWRDLPLLLNQWANIVRWEMRTRLFLRTAEFLWQEGHTAHATSEQAQEEALRMLEVYRVFVEETLAIPVVTGVKSPGERFAGAENTYTLEAMMQDKKALQAGTSHNLGQNFAKAFNIQFQDQKGQMQYVWQTSWGVSTRLMGAMIMTHGDDHGLIVPPVLAPIQVVIVPIYRRADERTQVLGKAREIINKLKDKVRVHLDDREQYKPGWKFYEWEKKGVPLRVELGPRDLAQNQVMLVSRLDSTKKPVPISNFLENCPSLLDQYQQNLLARARDFTQTHTFTLDSYDEFKKQIESPGGFFRLHWCGQAQCEEKVKADTKATIRCLPLETEPEKGKCIICGRESSQRAVFAKNY